MKSNWDNLALAARFGIAAYSAYQGYKRQGDITDYFLPTKKRPRLPTYTTTVKRKKKQQNSMSGPYFQKTRGRYVHRGYVGLNRRMKNLEEKVIQRFQGVSRFGIGGGFYKIGKIKMNDNNVMLPLHVMDLTYQPLNDAGVSNFNSWMIAYNNPVGSELLWAGHDSQTHQGGTVIGGGWAAERGTPTADVRTAIHKWTEVKFNLYGTIKRPVRYKIMLFKMNEDACFGHTAAGDVDTRTAAEAILRPYLYNNLLQSTGELNKHVRVLKSWHCDLDPLSKEEQAVVQEEGSTVTYNPHFRQVKIFVRHDIQYRYDWYNTPYATGMVQDGPVWDEHQVGAAPIASHAYPTARLFLGIVASCADTPLQIDAGNPAASVGSWNTRPDDRWVKEYGSYDMVVRRCMIYSNKDV